MRPPRKSHRRGPFGALVTALLACLCLFTTSLAQTPELTVQTGHTGYVVYKVRFSPDGRFVATAGENSVKIWDVATARELRSFPNKIFFHVNFDFSPDGRLFALWNEEKLLQIWDLFTGERVRTFEIAEGTYDTMHFGFSADGRSITSGYGPDEVRVWDVETGRRMAALKPDVGKRYVGGLDFEPHPDGRRVAVPSATKDENIGRIELWNLFTGEREMGFELSPGRPGEMYGATLAFSPDGSLLAIDGTDGVFVFDVRTGRELRFLELEFPQFLKFSADGKNLSAASDEILKTWKTDGWRETSSMSVADLERTEHLLELQDGTNHTDLSNIDISSDGRSMVMGSCNSTDDFSCGPGANVIIWELPAGRFSGILRANSQGILDAAVSPDGKVLAVADNFGSFRFFNLGDAGRPEMPLPGRTGIDPSNPLFDLQFTPDGRLLVGTGLYGTVATWDALTGRHLGAFGKMAQSVTAEMPPAVLGPDGKQLLIMDDPFEQDSLSVWEIVERRRVGGVSSNDGWRPVSAFTPDGRIVYVLQNDMGDKWSIRVHDPVTGSDSLLTEAAAELAAVSGPDSIATWNSLETSPDGRALAADIELWDVPEKKLRLILVWDLKSGRKLGSIRTEERIEKLAFGPEGKLLAGFRSGGKGPLVWDIATGEPVRDARPPVWVNTNRNYKRIGRVGKRALRADVDNGRILVRHADTGELLVSVIPLLDDEWAVVTPQGLYDASPKGRDFLHFTLGFETITLEQMKELYYVPGLLKSVLYDKPLPRVSLFGKNDLHPEVSFKRSGSDPRRLEITLKNRGGGIGPVRVLVNGKQVVADARPAGLDPARKEAVLEVDLGGAPFLSGAQNVIQVVASNASGALRNISLARGVETFADTPEKTSEPTEFYAIIGGVSDYTGDALDLNFAAKDAEDFARAVAAGASRLFGEERVHVRLLTSSADASGIALRGRDVKVLPATKAAFREAFREFTKARPNDVFVVYLAGHGVSYDLDAGGAGGDTYLYLTQEATTTDKNVLADERVRAATAISTEELVRWVTEENRALKQALILDTCAAGSAIPSLFARRDLPPDQIRALERLKDQTGFYVLMGSAADAVSYEASRYGQGLLTYSLLQALKGAGLREEKYASIGLLFEHAQTVVPQLAQDIGGIQKPEVLVPRTSESFDIGQFTETERLEIRLSEPKPVFLRPNLQNGTLLFDDQKLGPKLADALREKSHVRGGSVIYVNAREMADAFIPSGSYTVADGEITLRLVLVRNNRRFGAELTVRGPADKPEELIAAAVERILAAVKDGSKDQGSKELEIK